VTTLRNVLEITTNTFPDNLRANLHFALGVIANSIGRYAGDPELNKEAATALRTAIQEYRAVKDDRGWAKAQLKLGEALRNLTGTIDSREHLRRSVVAYREALSIFTVQQDPLLWAEANHGLGTAGADIAWTSGDMKGLLNSVDDFEKARKVWYSQKESIRFAYSTNNLGNVFLYLARLEGDTKWLLKAKAEYETAKKLADKHSPFIWRMATLNLAETLGWLGERQNNVLLLQQSVSNADSVMISVDCKEVAGLCGWGHFVLGWAKAIHGKVGSNLKDFKKGIQEMRDALNEPANIKRPAWRAELQIEFGRLLQDLSEREGNLEPLREAIAVHSEAKKTFETSAVGREYLIRENQRHLLNARRELERRATLSQISERI
jgi:hypothetical protein